MIGNFVYRKAPPVYRPVLDYRAYAEPLTIHKVKTDVDEIFVMRAISPDRIVLWEHQLDWLIKAAQVQNGYGAVAPHLERGERIWGIPLEVL